MSLRRLFSVLLFLCGLVVLGGVPLYRGLSGSASLSYRFTLVDHTGLVRSEKDFAAPWKLVYFGFTSCPVICPTELQKMAQAYLRLPETQQRLIQPLFISVDPERDTPEVLSNYVDLFLPNLIGLTGTPAQSAAAQRSYGATSRKVFAEGDQRGEYTVDHTSFIYFLGPGNRLAAQFKPSDSAAFMARRIADILASSP